MESKWLNIVPAGRKLGRDSVLELATGQLYTGTQALKLGLVDKLGGLDDAAREAADLAGLKHYTTIEFTPSLFETLIGLGATAQSLLTARLAGPEVYILENLLGSFSVPWY